MTDLTIPSDFYENAQTHTLVELGSIYNRSTSTIVKWKRKVGVEVKVKRQNIPIPDDLCGFAPHYTIGEFAERYRVSAATVKSWLKKRGVKQKGAHRGAYKRKQELVTDSPEQIAACLHCPYMDCRCLSATAPCFPKEVLDVIC